MSQQCAYKGKISLEFRYKETANSPVQVKKIESQRISYLMIEHMYENIHILPVVYICLNVSSDMYSEIVGTTETSKFHVVVKKKNALSNTSIYRKVLDDEFTYVTSSNSANYADTLNRGSADSYKNIMIGLVSTDMSNKLRKNYNAIYNDIFTEDLINLALDGLGTIVKAPLKHNSKFGSILVPPISSRYKLLEYIRQKSPFYDSNYTFYMDFDKTYLIPKNGQPISDGSKPDTANIIIKNFTSEDAYKDGYTIVNGAYVMNINATDTSMIINNSASKVTNNVIGYSDYYSEAQDFNIDNNNTVDNTTKTTFVRSNNAAELRNELENNSVLIQLMKQNVDGDIFTPNMCFNVTNYGDYSKYDGRYYLSFKRDFYYISENEEFIITSNIGLKMAGNEEVARSTKNVYNSGSLRVTRGRTTTTSSAKYSSKSSVKRSTTTSTSKK